MDNPSRAPSAVLAAAQYTRTDGPRPGPWWGHRVGCATRKIQRDAVRGISAAGGVRYNWQYVSGKYDPKASPPGPKWLRDIVGPDLLDTVVLANLQGPNADDRVMSHVGALSGVERFNLQGKTSPSLTAAGMARIGQLPRLQQFWVQGMTDSSGFLPYLFDKPRLRSIWLQAAAVTDGDLARLAAPDEARGVAAQRQERYG